MTGDDDFEPLAPALESRFDSDKPFAELPKYVQKRIARAMGFYIPAALSPKVKQERRNRARRHKISVTLLPDYVRERNALTQSLSHAAVLWGRSSPSWRRREVQHRDIEKHPGLAVEREALWKKSQEIADYERTASHIPLEKRPVSDVELQKTILRKLREEEAALEAKLQRKAESLGLGWPYDEGNIGAEPASPVKPSKKPRLSYSEARPWWVGEFLPQYPDPDQRPNAEEQRKAAAAAFPNHEPPSEATMKSLRANKATPAEWREPGRRPEQEIE